MSDSEKSQESAEREKTLEQIKEVVDPGLAWLASAVTTQQLRDADEAVMLQDKQQVLAEQRRKERATVKHNKETGLLEYEDQKAEDVGDIHIGNKIEVRQVDKDAPTQQPAAAKANGLAKVALGALAATGLLGVGGLGAYLVSQLSKPPAVEIKETVITPAPEPPSTNVYLE